MFRAIRFQNVTTHTPLYQARAAGSGRVVFMWQRVLFLFFVIALLIAAGSLLGTNAVADPATTPAAPAPASTPARSRLEPALKKEFTSRLADKAGSNPAAAPAAPRQGTAPGSSDGTNSNGVSAIRSGDTGSVK